jgi:exodeoxyribonuclease VII small subunit
MAKTEKQELKYEEAVQQLEAIVEKLENNELGIDELSTELKKAQQLIQLCKDKLTKTDAEIKKILDKD